jgi:hypothetical protein
VSPTQVAGINEIKIMSADGPSYLPDILETSGRQFRIQLTGYHLFLIVDGLSVADEIEFGSRAY